MTFPANYPSDLARTEPVRRCADVWPAPTLDTAEAFRKHAGSALSGLPAARQELDPSAARPDSCSLRVRPQVFRRSLDQSGHKRTGVGRHAAVQAIPVFRCQRTSHRISEIGCAHDRITHTRQESIMDRANRRASFWLRFPMPNAREPDGNRTPCSRVRGRRDRPLWNRLRGRSAHIHGHGRRS